ncbi:aminotransferase class I/II-fold pyridoxal phosphate-dependent enzyme [Cohnella sp.]|uniref:aminotransferase class I/II-fold pyridoxal phosphate-dependent enzyme n=1 Tax=Cohnella sp. TaxID=1883426 RepID=UPI003567F67F
MSLNKFKAPLFEALVAHKRLQGNAFHVPGHKQQAAWHNEEAIAHFDALLALDVTELSDTDDLHHPQGPLAEAQKLAADCYQAEDTSFLVGGSTAGNLAMILGTCNPGEIFIVQRNVHKSIIHGLMIAGAKAVLLPPHIDSISGLATVPSEALLEAAISRYPESKAVIVTSPNYYGMGHNLKTLIELVHNRGIPVLVDEAHGPHFGFHPSFPGPALQAGADLVVQSTHKMLSAMTMGAMLHMQGNLIRKAAVKQALRMVQSSSPSFPLMASLDLARQQIHTAGAAAFQPALEAVEYVINQLKETPFRALGYGQYANSELAYDPLKMVLFDESAKLSGLELRNELLRHNCVAEMSDSRYVVMAFGIGSRQADGIALINALEEIAKQINNQPKRLTSIPLTDNSPVPDSKIPEAVAFSREEHRTKSIKLENCSGFTSAEWIIPYPPGIPILYPGEIITLEIIEQLQYWRRAGVQIQGAQDSELASIQVQMKK